MGVVTATVTLGAPAIGRAAHQNATPPDHGHDSATPIALSRLVRYTVERGPDGTEFVGFGGDGISFHPDNPPCRTHLDDFTGK